MQFSISNLCATFCTALFSLSFFITTAQSSFDKAWESLSQPDIVESIDLFESTIKENPNDERALITLAYLYSFSNRVEKSAELIKKFYDVSENPHPELYAIWFDKGVAGETGKKDAHQLKLIERIIDDPRSLETLRTSCLYNLGIHSLISRKPNDAHEYFGQINTINEWQTLGPFDDVMSSGYDKDFGVVDHPEDSYQFSSKYGAPIHWEKPNYTLFDNYFTNEQFFANSACLMYGQSFVSSPTDQEAILKLGYGGTVKLWVNDSCIYHEPETRFTDIDNYAFKIKLKKGGNRILVQLGDFKVNYAYFSVRFTDLAHQPLDLTVSQATIPYTKGVEVAEQLPHWAISFFEDRLKENPNDVYNMLMLCKSYLRARNVGAADEIISKALELEPNNYLLLREMVFLSRKSADDTNQNIYYEAISDNFPDDHDILLQKIEEAVDAEERGEAEKLIKRYAELYGNTQTDLEQELQLAKLEKDWDKVILLINKLYNKYPDTYDYVIGKYILSKNLKSLPKEYNKILEDYLDDTYSWDVFNELISNYMDIGKSAKAMGMVVSALRATPKDVSLLNLEIGLLVKLGKFDEAIDVANSILEFRPTDFTTMDRLAQIYEITGDTENTKKYYEMALEYFPFSFSTNNTIRVLDSKESVFDLFTDVNPSEIIDEYKENKAFEESAAYNMVYSQESVVIFKSRAVGKRKVYIAEIVKEGGLETWQHLNLAPRGNFELTISEAKVLKKDGRKLDAEQHRSEVVFTNLEVGDFVYLEYMETQEGGGKSSMFVNQRYYLNSYVPAYKRNYEVFIEDGLAYDQLSLNGAEEPKKEPVDGFTKLNWQVTNVEAIESEVAALAYSDLAQRAEILLSCTWDDIAQWYSDLSSIQAAPDSHIRALVKEIIDEPGLSDIEKAKRIYAFVIENVQYSSIDFRQTAYIPVRASDVYHSKLGDCKDMSTLFVALAREAGLHANLVLINTSNNGKLDVVSPSLNFNHCIVNLALADENIYLELTNPNLPFGYLGHNHLNAAILNIPHNTPIANCKLEYLSHNKGYTNNIHRISTCHVNKDKEIEAHFDVIKTGATAARSCDSYYQITDDERREKLERSISSRYNSTVTLEELNFPILQPRSDTARYNYTYNVQRDVMKIGSFNSLKVPFSDLLVELDKVQAKERHNPFNFNRYEPNDSYVHEIDVTLDKSFAFTETPKNLKYDFNGSTYELTFKLLSPQKMRVQRSYTVNHENIEPEQYAELKEFFTNIVEAENSHLVFQ